MGAMGRDVLEEEIWRREWRWEVEGGGAGCGWAVRGRMWGVTMAD